MSLTNLTLHAAAELRKTGVCEAKSPTSGLLVIELAESIIHCPVVVSVDSRTGMITDATGSNPDQWMVSRCHNVPLPVLCAIDVLRRVARPFMDNPPIAPSLAMDLDPGVSVVATRLWAKDPASPEMEAYILVEVVLDGARVYATIAANPYGDTEFHDWWTIGQESLSALSGRLVGTARERIERSMRKFKVTCED